MQFERLAPRAFLILVLCGVLSVVVHYRARGHARLGQGETVWRLTYFIEFVARQSGAELRVATPADTQHSRVFRQDFRQDNLRIDPRGRSSSQAREIVALAEQPGRCESTLQFDIRLNSRDNRLGNGAPVTLTSNERANYLRPTENIQILDERVTGTLADLRQRDSGQAALVHDLFEFCQREIVTCEEDAAEDAATVLERGAGSALGCARAMIALCRAAKIPARPVTGFIVDSSQRSSTSVWVEALLNDHWIPYDPVHGYEQELPYDFLPARRGDDRVAITRKGKDLEIEYSLVQLPKASLGASAGERHLTDILDLTRLPLDIQQVLSVILLMPLGALVTCVFRNIVGLKTSGTFTPTLLALSFVFASWQTGLVILVTAVVLGIATRYLIDRLKLLILPRLSIMLTLVVLCIVFGVSALSYFRVAPGAHVVLLPMVILTMLVERFYLTTQEDGMHIALQHLAGSAIVGFCCYLVLCWATVANLCLAYPEVHFFTAALMVLIGRYTGYQMLEPWRFRHFADLKQT